MASISRIGDRWRALVRRAGTTRCKTFGSRALAKAWSDTIEQQIDQMKATGYLHPKGLTIADLFDRYQAEFYPTHRWGRSKSADLKRLRAEFGARRVEDLTHEAIIEKFLAMHEGGAGGVVLSALAGYLITVLEAAQAVWKLAVPLDAARSARSALSILGLITKSKQRDRRVTDAELAKVVTHVERKATAIPFGDIVWFSVATSMRISEVCRLQWDDLNEVDKTIRIRDRKHPSAKIGNHQIVPLLENLCGHNAYALATKQPKKGKLIFPVNPRTVGDYFSEAVEQLGIEDLHFHDIRHEAISRLFAAGYHIEEVSVFSGHRDWSMLKRYTHLRAVDLHRAPK